jgi:hypothetical protein
MSLDKVREWFKDDSKRATYQEGMSLLKASGVLEFLKEIAIPKMVENGKDVHVMASQAAYSAGYFACINDLSELFTYSGLHDKRVELGRPDFGGVKLAIKRGDLKEGEL